MNKQQIFHLKEQYQLIDQTAFIDTLLRQDKSRQYINCLKNLNIYQTTFSTEEFKGTDIDYYHQLKDLQEELEASTDETDQAKIRQDISAVENSYQGERAVNYWYAIPYWLGNDLEGQGEVILSILGSSWWGVTEDVE